MIVSLCRCCLVLSLALSQLGYPATGGRVAMVAEA
jgi:hypothetical protein